MRRKVLALAMTVLLAASASGCANSTQDAQGKGNPAQAAAGTAAVFASDVSVEEHSTDISDSLVYDHSMERAAAKMFAVDYYEGGYALVTVAADGQYLVVPEGQSAPEDLADGITILQQPLTNIYLVASAVMDMFVSMDALDSLRFSALEEDGWYIDEAAERMETGDLLYAGKYSAPDYELIVSEGCGLAIENTMIYHTPEVKEKLQQFGIPVMVDYSSYENDPLGRIEWVKLYGVLTGCEERAQEVFENQSGLFERVRAQEAGGQTVAFFYITSNGTVNVRKTTDYLPKMIELAGGRYIFDGLGEEEENASSTVSMQMEEFYAVAKEADYFIYNSAIEGELESIDDLLELAPLLEKCRAVQEGHVYCTSKNLYQASMQLGTITLDINRMLCEETADLTYLYPVR